MMDKGIDEIEQIIRNYLDDSWGYYDTDTPTNPNANSTNRTMTRFGTELKRKLEGEFNFNFVRDLTSITTHLYTKGMKLAQFTLTFFPSCKHMVVFEKVNIEPEFRGLGLGELLHMLRLAVVRVIPSVAWAMCTAREENIPQCKILQKFGWQKKEVVMEYEWVEGGMRNYVVALWMKKVRR